MIGLIIALHPMPLSRTIFTVKLVGKDRVLFSILEKPNGELIIPVRHPERAGAHYATSVQILEKRYSIHPSERSTEFTTIKSTANLADGQHITTVALTYAVKKRTGFYLLFVRRVQNLSDEKYALSEKDRERSQIFSLPEYDLTCFDLFYGVIIGPPDFEFKPAVPNPALRVIQHRFLSFRVVILAGQFSIPTLHTSETMNILTFDPKVYDNFEDQNAMRIAMTGKPADACLFQFTNGTLILAKRCLEYALASGEIDDPALVAVLKEGIAHLDTQIIPLALDIRQKSDGKLTDGKPPSILSLSQPQSDDQ